MFFIHGAFDSEKHRGVVADHCAACGAPTIQRLMQQYRTPHLYFIPLGSQFVGSTLVCTGCGGKTACPNGRYATTLPELEAMSMQFGRVLVETNPRLAETIARRTLHEQEARDLAGQESDGHNTRVQLAMSRFAALDCDEPRTVELEARLGRWKTFDAVGKARLLHDIEALVSQVYQKQSSSLLVKLMAERLKPNPDGFVEFLTLLVVFGIGAAMTALFLRGSNAGVVAGAVLSFVAAAAAALWVHHRVDQWSFRRFFRKVLLPEAEIKGIELSAIMHALGEVDTADNGTDPRLRRMAKALPVLRDLVVEQNPEMYQVAAE